MLNANLAFTNRAMMLGETRRASLYELANIAAFVLTTVVSIAAATGIVELISRI